MTQRLTLELCVQIAAFLEAAIPARRHGKAARPDAASWRRDRRRLKSSVAAVRNSVVWLPRAVVSDPPSRPSW